MGGWELRGWLASLLIGVHKYAKTDPLRSLSSEGSGVPLQTPHTIVVSEGETAPLMILINHRRCALMAQERAILGYLGQPRQTSPSGPERSGASASPLTSIWNRAKITMTTDSEKQHVSGFWGGAPFPFHRIYAKQRVKCLSFFGLLFFVCQRVKCIGVLLGEIDGPGRWLNHQVNQGHPFFYGQMRVFPWGVSAGNPPSRPGWSPSWRSPHSRCRTPHMAAGDSPRVIGSCSEAALGCSPSCS